MPVTPGHFTLTPEQREFKQLLNQFPSLVAYWNFQTRDCDVSALESAIPALSHGERSWLGSSLLSGWARTGSISI